MADNGVGGVVDRIASPEETEKKIHLIPAAPQGTAESDLRIEATELVENGSADGHVGGDPTAPDQEFVDETGFPEAGARGLAERLRKSGSEGVNRAGDDRRLRVFERLGEGVAPIRIRNGIIVEEGDQIRMSQRRTAIPLAVGRGIGRRQNVDSRVLPAHLSQPCLGVIGRVLSHDDDFVGLDRLLGVQAGQTLLEKVASVARNDHDGDHEGDGRASSVRTRSSTCRQALSEWRCWMDAAAACRRGPNAPG